MGVVEITGTEGTLVIPDPNRFTGRSRSPGPPTSPPDAAPRWENVDVTGVYAERGLGVLDLARAARTGGAPLASGRPRLPRARHPGRHRRGRDPAPRGRGREPGRAGAAGRGRPSTRSRPPCSTRARLGLAGSLTRPVAPDLTCWRGSGTVVRGSGVAYGWWCAGFSDREQYVVVEHSTLLLPCLIGRSRCSGSGVHAMSNCSVWTRCSGTPRASSASSVSWISPGGPQRK